MDSTATAAVDPGLVQGPLGSPGQGSRQPKREFELFGFLAPRDTSPSTSDLRRLRSDPILGRQTSEVGNGLYSYGGRGPGPCSRAPR